MSNPKITDQDFWKHSPYTVEKACEECQRVDRELKEQLKKLGMPLDDISLIKIGYGIDGGYQYCFTLFLCHKIRGRFFLNDNLNNIACGFLHLYEKNILDNHEE